MIFLAKIEWIKSDFGGRTKPPALGLKPTIRFQKYIEEWMSSAWDVEIVDLDIDLDTWTSTAKLELPKNAPLNLKGLEAGELFELLDAYRVIGVGKIVELA